MSPPAPEILVVDDDQDTRTSLTEILLQAGYRVREAADGRRCLAAVAERTPSLILLDVTMPELDGFETLRLLGRRPGPELPVILLTGHRLDAGSIGAGLELGAIEYLAKPVRPDELVARLRALLRLAQARRELEALKRDQAAMLVHDLKQPLAIISLRAEFVRDEATDPELVRSGQAIREACRQMEAIITSVLELSRVEAGQLRLLRTPCRVDVLVAEVVAQLRGLAERRGVRLACRAADGMPPVEGDRPKLIQVLQNLLGNALKFTPAGGRIDVEVVAMGGRLVIAVEDTGCGVAAADQERVFERWAQSTTGQATGGTGLGLAICRAIVEAHGGHIAAGPRLDGTQGARFWLELPLAGPEAGVARA